MKHIQPVLTPSQLGVQLQGARKSRNLTQAQLAARLGISQNRLSDLERHPGTLSVDQLLALCNQLGLQLGLQVAGRSSELEGLVGVVAGSFAVETLGVDGGQLGQELRPGGWVDVRILTQRPVLVGGANHVADQPEGRRSGDAKPIP